MKKILAMILLVMMILATFCMPISAKYSGEYTSFDVSNIDYVKGTKLELNDIDDGLRQAVNDACENQYGCEVTFETNAKKGAKARLTANGINKLSDTVTTNGDFFTFQFDELNPQHNLWGCISQLEFECSEDVRIYDVYIYIPPQPIFEELSAGACCYEKVILLE